jgi:hypothetical protein
MAQSVISGGKNKKRQAAGVIVHPSGLSLFS